ncbi:hypothetical protein THAOC_17463 [Thalassiosira oceanica]|uniref:Uncharacterized protein n=1 Tax=Thalassiosira oceanica TaxID=159749 RepID=K0S9I3_THAOC|nr:hypothetical protein THAOC_17463 [Thalassiosira oceanica]|eukprot:EJK61955.1 hypothetical protein THAOC_17463 [Thalassiosira oceanica]
MFYAQFCLAFALVNAAQWLLMADALILFTQTSRTPPSSASSAGPTMIHTDPVGIVRRHPSLTICDAKLGKIAQNFDLDEILENELMFGDETVDGDTPSTEDAGSKRRGSRRHKSEGKKQRRKNQMKKERLENSDGRRTTPQEKPVTAV